MNELIILTAAEADSVRGKSSSMAAIEPVALKDGTFILNVTVLADPTHAEHLSKLINLTKSDVLSVEALRQDSE
jgi:hypothetical protein